MALNNLGLGFVFTARDLATAKMRSLERRFRSLDNTTDDATKRISKNFKSLAVGLGTLTVGAVALGGSFAAAATAGRFEQGLASVGAVTKSTTEQLKLLRDAAVRAGIETQFSPEQAVEGLQSLATAGQTARQSSQTLIPVLDLAAGSLGQLGVAGAAEAVVGTLNAYGKSAGEASGVTDRLLRITQLTNFQTRDFEVGLSKAAATGATFGQRLSDVLITMGLLRNRNIDASSSATALRESVRRLGADQRAQQAIQQTGVRVFDRTTGQMRSVLDIMTDFAKATEILSEAERNRRVVTAFGARGLLAFNAVQKAAFTTTKNGRQVTLQGAQAIEALRRQMARASGTAAEFRDKLLNTFAGQQTLLQGTVDTLKITFGEPFAKVLKPAVAAVTITLNGVIKAFKALPEPVKKAFAGLVVGLGVMLSLVGGFIAAKAAIGLLSLGLSALGITLSGILAAALPVTLAVGLLGAAIAGFVVAFRRNVGGIATFSARTFATVKLLFSAMAQLFAEGGFSGAVMKELHRAENLGIKQFAINIFRIVFRIKRVFSGFAQGFVDAIVDIEPLFGFLRDAFVELGQALGIAGSGFETVAGAGSDKFFAAGAIIGQAVGRIAGAVAIALGTVVRLVSGIFTLLKNVGASLGRLGAGVKQLFEGDIVPGLKNLGNGLLGFFVSIGDGILSIFGVKIANVQKTVEAFRQGLEGLFFNAFVKIDEAITGFFSSIGNFFVGIGRGIRDFFGGIVDWFRSKVDKLIAFSGRAVSKLPSFLRPGSTDLIIQAGQQAQARIDAKQQAGGQIVSGIGLSRNRSGAALSRSEAGRNGFGRLTALSALRDRAVVPAATETRAKMQTDDRLLSALAANQQSSQKAIDRLSQRPIQVRLDVDGDTLAQTTVRARREQALRSFAPVPAT